jgi:hypothetical protein
MVDDEDGGPRRDGGEREGRSKRTFLFSSPSRFVDFPRISPFALRRAPRTTLLPPFSLQRVIEWAALKKVEK